MRDRGEKVKCGAMTLAGWSVAVCGGQTKEGCCRLGFALGTTSPTIRGPRHLIQWPPQVCRETGGEQPRRGGLCVQRRAGPHGLDLPPGLAGPEDCDSLFTHLQTNQTIDEKYSAWRPLGIQQASDDGDNAYRIPGPGIPADGLTDVKSGLAPLLRLLHSGSFCPEAIRPLRGMTFEEASSA